MKYLFYPVLGNKVICPTIEEVKFTSLSSIDYDFMFTLNSLKSLLDKMDRISHN